MNYGGVWYAPGGNSFTAHLIRDAGGCYLWASDTSRELTFTLEEIMLVADSADVWVNPGAFSSAEDILAAEPRVRHIRAFREKRVCQNDGRRGPGGGNDFYESAVAYPAELLQSLRTCIQKAGIYGLLEIVPTYCSLTVYYEPLILPKRNLTGTAIFLSFRI